MYPFVPGSKVSRRNSSCLKGSYISVARISVRNRRAEPSLEGLSRAIPSDVQCKSEEEPGAKGETDLEESNHGRC